MQMSCAARPPFSSPRNSHPTAGESTADSSFTAPASSATFIRPLQRAMAPHRVSASVTAPEALSSTAAETSDSRPVNIPQTIAAAGSIIRIYFMSYQLLV